VWYSLAIKENEPREVGKKNQSNYSKEDGKMKKELITKVKALAANKKVVMATQIVAAAVITVIAALTVSGNVFASNGADFTGVTTPIVGLINSLVNPLLLLVGAGGTIFCILLGVKFATAEEPQEKEKRKQSLKTAIIGFFLIFILVVALKLSINPLTTWMQNSTKGANTTIQLDNTESTETK